MDNAMRQFRSRLEAEVLAHPVIIDNAYARWFARGEMTVAQAQAFLIQFSVFSNQFLVAQLHKMVNAETLEEMRSSKEILANEIGVGFRGRSQDDAELGSIDGSIEGGRFHFRAAHFELLARMAEQLGLGFEQLGKRRLGTPATLFFCDELTRLYGNEDSSIAKAASWAVENWAAAGFWDELVQGWRKFREREQRPRLNLTFFTWHARLEANHARHTWEELEAYYRDEPVDEHAFIRHANEMLDGVHAFWRGLDEQRREIAAEERVGLHMAS